MSKKLTFEQPEPFTNEMESMLTVQCLRALNAEQRERLASKIAPHPTKSEPSRLEVAKEIFCSYIMAGKGYSKSIITTSYVAADELIKQSKL